VVFVLLDMEKVEKVGWDEIFIPAREWYTDGSE
jgi:hypothetical protein